MTYSIELLKTAHKQLAKIPRKDRLKIADRIDELAEDPRPIGHKKLAASKDFYRIRAGDYRIIYQIRDDILLVLIVEIGHRREVYR
jgi:mRNA interferase RelE/StbE